MSHPIIRVQLENSIYDRLVEESIRYALISLPYTINRMKLKQVESRVLNIAKGKLSEELFYTFCYFNEIPISTDLCTTPFHLPDKRDFILGREEWDIKNNFLSSFEHILTQNDYLSLPALIPNRGDWDQWSKRKTCIHGPETESVNYLFSFMNGFRDGKPFLTLSLTESQIEFIMYLLAEVKKYKSPYEASWFWEKMQTKGNGKPFRFSVNFHPELVICGMAEPKDFEKFTLLNPQSFHKDLFKTRIQNMGVPIHLLQSFVNLYPRLKEQIKSGELLF